MSVKKSFQIEKLDERIAPAVLSGLLAGAAGIVSSTTPHVTGAVSTAAGTTNGLIDHVSGKVVSALQSPVSAGVSASALGHSVSFGL